MSGRRADAGHGRWSSAAALPLVALAACGSALGGVPSPLRAADHIAESVLEHMMAAPETAPAVAEVGTVCVALGPLRQRSDPDPLFIGRFKGASPPVRAWSECALDVGRGDRLVHVPTGDPAIGYTIDWPRAITTRRVFVGVAYYITALDAAGYVCEVALEDDAWQVESCKRTWLA